MGEFDGMGQGGAVYYLASWPLNKMYMLSLAVSAVCVCPDLMVDHSNLPTFPFHFFPSINFTSSTKQAQHYFHNSAFFLRVSSRQSVRYLQTKLESKLQTHGL